MTKVNLLITGCGGDLGASIARICNAEKLIGKIIGCNNHSRHFSQYLVDKHYLVNDFGTKEYEDQIEKIVKQEKIDLIVPVSEIELRLISSGNYSNPFRSTPYISANNYAMEIGFDKLSTVNFLKEIGVPYPKTYIFSNLKNELNYPFIIKSRQGYGSQSVLLINNISEREYFLSKFPDYIAQEYLDGENSEYTCGVFFTKGLEEPRIIVFRRNLYEGTTSNGEVVNSVEISNVVKTIARKLNLLGSINVQLRITAKGPTVFEINPRFSSTVRFRHLLGFKDFIWSIRDKLSLPVREYHPPPEGAQFYRESNEKLLKKDINF